MKFKKIKYFIEDHEYEENFDIELKFTAFIILVEVTHKINFKQYESFYLNQKIAPKYHNWPLIDLIRIDENPVFVFKKINFHNITLENKKNIVEICKKQKIEISLTNISSYKNEIIQIIQDLISKEKFNFKFFEKKDGIIIQLFGVDSGMKLLRRLNSIKQDKEQFLSTNIKLKIINDSFKKSWEETNLFKQTNVDFLIRHLEFGFLQKI